MYAVLREDLHMSPGKAAAQAGHAFLDTFIKAPLDLAHAYMQYGHGTKIVLLASNEDALWAIHDAAQSRNIPTQIVIDSGHVMLPYFDGSEIITAVGLGPVLREQVDDLTGELKLL